MALYKSIHSKRRYCILTLLTGLILLSCDVLGLFEGMNNHGHDLLFRLRGQHSPVKNIVIIAIDDLTLEELGQWPISRQYYVSLLKKLQDAKAIGFDIFFPDYAANDQEFADALQKHGKVILATYISIQKGVVQPAFPFPANHSGHVHLDMGIDGVFRNVFHTIKYRNTSVPSFSTLLQQLVKTGSIPINTVPDNQQQSLPPHSLQQQDMTGINYYGNAGTFQYIPLIEILNGDKWPASYFADKIALVGVTAIGQKDFVLIPFSENGNGMPGVEVQATILSNLLDKSRIYKPSESFLFILQCIVTLVLVISISLFLYQRLIILYPVIFLCMLAICCWLFLSFMIWLPPAYILVFLSANFICAYICKLEDMKRSLDQANSDWHDSFNSMQEGVVIQNFSGETLLSNQNGQRLKGETTVNVLKDRTSSLAADNNSVKDLTISDPTLNKHLEISSLIRRDADGNKSGVMHVIRDITSFKEMQEKESLLQAQLVKAQKMESIGRLAGGVAHDFNNVLSAVIGFSEMIRLQTPAESDINDYAKSIAKSGTRGATLARQLLVFSRKQSMEKAVIDPFMLIENMMKMLQRMIDKDINISIDTTGPLTGKIFADPGQIEQVLMNLVVNAGDAMANGGNIILSAKDQEVLLEREVLSGTLTPGSYVIISVLDSGTGIPSEQLEYIFEPFFSTKSEERGTGLGLSTVYGIVTQHNGLIDVQSAVGFGTTFSTYFPRCTQEFVGKKEESNGILERGNESILLVEHEPFFKKVMTDIMIHLGYKVISVKNDLEAIAFCQEKGNHTDLLITSLVKPGMSGKYLGDKLRKKFCDLQVLYISDCQEDIMTRFGNWSSDFEYYLQKPITPSNLAKKIRKIFNTASPETTSHP